jgi:hypothetical protein
MGDRKTKGKRDKSKDRKKAKRDKSNTKGNVLSTRRKLNTLKSLKEK